MWFTNSVLAMSTSLERAILLLERNIIFHAIKTLLKLESLHIVHSFKPYNQNRK